MKAMGLINLETNLIILEEISKSFTQIKPETLEQHPRSRHPGKLFFQSLAKMSHGVFPSRKFSSATRQFHSRFRVVHIIFTSHRALTAIKKILNFQFSILIFHEFSFSTRGKVSLSVVVGKLFCAREEALNFGVRAQFEEVAEL